MPHYPGALTSKLPRVGTTIFTVMSRLAAEHGAINLSQGFPDFDCAPELRALAARYLNAGLNQYPPMAGVAALREAIAEKVAALYGAAYDPESEVTVVPGATYGIFTAVAALVRPGDEVILFEPAYDSYAPAVEVNGGTPVYVQLTYPDYAIDWEAVERAITPRTRLVVVNTPNNPTASVFSAEDLRTLEGLLRKTDIVVVSDEVYEHIVFDGHAHQSVARSRASRAQLPRFFVRQDLSRHRLEDGLCPGARRAHERVPQGAPVQRVRGERAAAVRARRIHEGQGPLPRACVLLSAQARSLSRRRPRLALHSAPLAGHLLPESFLRARERRAGHGARRAAHPRARDRLHSGVGVLP
jgi:hypothetical protein